jgi:hypothetical protein
MKITLVLSAAALFALPAWAADLADEVKAAAKKLADQPNYSWSVKVESPQQGRGRGLGGPPSGKTEKDGYTLLTYTVGDRTTEAVRKGDKVALKTGEEWKSAEELAADSGDGAPNRQRFLARAVQQAKLPASDAQELAGRVKDLKKDGDAYTGALSADAIKQRFGARQAGPGGDAAGGGAGGPDTSGLKGTAKFWIKDGVLSKYETRIEGKMTFGQNNQEREINRATITEIQAIGSTKIEVPAEAKKKLGA